MCPEVAWVLGTTLPVSKDPFLYPLELLVNVQVNPLNAQSVLCVQPSSSCTGWSLPYPAGFSNGGSFLFHLPCNADRRCVSVSRVPHCCFQIILFLSSLKFSASNLTLLYSASHCPSSFQSSSNLQDVPCYSHIDNPSVSGPSVPWPPLFQGSCLPPCVPMVILWCDSHHSSSCPEPALRVHRCLLTSQLPLQPPHIIGPASFSLFVTSSSLTLSSLVSEYNHNHSLTHTLLLFCPFYLLG